MKDFSVTYYRGSLKTEAAKRYYDLLTAQLEKKNGRFVFTFPLIGKNPLQDASDAISAVRDDRPDFFFLREAHISQAREITITFRSPYTADEVKRLEPILRHNLAKIVRGTDRMSQLRKEQVIYKRIIDSIRYDMNKGVHQYSVVGPLVYHAGVCAAIAAMVTLAFRKAGIPCITVHGECLDGEKHAWNLAWIHGTPCHLDATHDAKLDGNVPYFYFNLTDDEIRKTRRFDAGNLPACRDARMEFHRCQKTYFRDARSAEAFIHEGLMRRAPVIRLKVAPGVDLRSCFDRAFAIPGTPAGRIRYYTSTSGDSMMILRTA